MCLNPQYVSKVHSYVDCGKCIECKLKRSRQWAFRIALEARLYSENCLLTLTYNDANLPEGASLSRRDLQLFLKKLRKALAPRKIRFFACGEYGEKPKKKGDPRRPHYHVIIFGWKPSDLFFLKVDQKGNTLYRSLLVEKCWDKGFISVGEVTFESAKYVAIYLQKAPAPLKSGFKQARPFVVMSRRPGIGYDAFKPEWLASDKIYIDGKYVSIPRYFLDVLERDFGYDLTEFREKRKDRPENDLIVYSPEWFNFKHSIQLRRDKYERSFKKSLDKFFNI